MRIAIAGGTGRHVADWLQRSGHDVAVISRSAGVHILTGTGLAETLTVLRQDRALNTQEFA